MKKVININFQGQVIAIEESAYEILKQYISSLKGYFSHEDGGEEIVNDIECRIAELFGNRLKHGISCITDEDVKSIIDSIGRPQDFDADYEEAESSAKKSQEAGGSFANGDASSVENDRQSLYRNSGDQIIGGVCSGLAHYFKVDPVWIRLLFVLFFGILFWVYIVLWIVLKPRVLESNVSRRIYRNPNDRFIGGVCGGIAAYFRIDPWIPRVLFLAPLLLNMIGMASVFPLNRLFDNIGFNWDFNMGMVVVYVVLWAIIPAAKTVKQKLEMMGEEEYIRSIREKVTDNVANSKNRNMPEDDRFSESEKIVSGISDEKSPHLGEMPPEPPQGKKFKSSQTQPSERSGCLKLFVLLLKIAFFSFVGMILLVFLAVFIGLLAAGTQLLPLKSLFIDPGYETNLMYLSLGIIFLVPVIGVVIWIFRRSMKLKSCPAIGIIASVIWIAGLVLSGVLGARVANKFSVESSSQRIVDIAPVSSSKMYIEMVPYLDDYAVIRSGYGPGTYVDELPYVTVNEDSLLFKDINLQIGKSNDSLFHVKVISAIHGTDLRSAKAQISHFSYNIQQQDSLILLPEFFMVPIEQGYRKQSVTVEVLVPAGKTVEMSEALEEYKNNRPPSVVRKRIKAYSRNSNYVPVDVSEESEELIIFSSDTI